MLINWISVAIPLPAKVAEIKTLAKIICLLGSGENDLKWFCNLWNLHETGWLWLLVSGTNITSTESCLPWPTVPANQQQESWLGRHLARV